MLRPDRNGSRRPLCARRHAGAFIVAAVAVACVAGVPVRAGASGPATRAVLVAAPGHLADADLAVTRGGGKVLQVMQALDESVVAVDASLAALLSRSPGVVSVTPDQPMTPLGASWDPRTDTGSMANTATITGADNYWAAGYTGQGVDVALIDTGVVPVEGLQGKVINGPDLSFDAGFPPVRFLDEYGHGTHMAGIIAGRDGGADAPYTDPSQFTGIAPDARIVNVKVGDATGATTETQVIGAIDWVIAHRTDHGMNIRVLNLAFGIETQRAWNSDPLALAVTAAWAHGVVVVTSAGNDGADTRRLNDPAIAPSVIAVGAADTQATLATSDDTVAAFSSTGEQRHPDLVAPGVHIVSLRDPGSFIDQTYGSTGAVGDRFFRGSGTSQAAAVVSGAAALLLSQHPELTPDQVKAMLTASATSLAGQPATRQGSGELDLQRMLAAPVAQVPSSADGEPTGGRSSDGPSPDPGAQGTGDGAPDGNTWSGNTWSGNTWSGNTWSGNTWSGNTWSGNTWSGNTWSGNTWSGNTWSGNTWSGNTWSGNTWSGNTWSGNTWSGNTWSGNTWSGNTWSGNTWSGNTWSGNTWS
jgi:serine protease AprX